MSVRRMLPFVILNIFVSAAVVLGILFWWDSRRAEEPTTIVNAPGASLTAVQVTAAAPTPLPRNTDTPTPDAGPLTHIVKPGDTLGSISQFYDVTLDDIMAANGISNPNLLSVGQELIIPVGGLATATLVATATLDPNLVPSPIPTDPADEPAGEGEAVIEITAVIGAGNLTAETVQLTNRGGRQVAMLDWQLADADGHVYTFGQVTLFGDGAAIELHTETGQDGPADLYWGLEEPVWEPGELVTLLDAEGTIRATLQVP
ncbi:MAG: LysM peptidoglycan-binding domain-containing protein [Anaerolineae bacterium]